jgi:hypothetical protein
MHAEVAPPETSTVDRALRALRSLGLIGLLGGLAALSALWAFGPQPDTIDGWRMLVSAMRAIFYPCVFAGILILVPVGLTLWWRRRGALGGQRWFRVMAIILLISIPTLHISARLTSHALRTAVEVGDLARAGVLWNRLGWLFVSAFAVLLIAAWIAVTKPRMGQREQMIQ